MSDMSGHKKCRAEQVLDGSIVKNSSQNRE